MRDHDLDMWEREAPTPDDDPPEPDQSEDEPAERYDVIAVEIATGRERFLGTDMGSPDAEAIIAMAIARRGVETEIYKKVPHPHCADPLLGLGGGDTVAPSDAEFTTEHPEE